MYFIFLIVLGAVAGALVKKKLSLLCFLPTITLWLLLATVFLMGNEVDLHSLDQSMIIQAIGLSLAVIGGSVLSLWATLYFLPRARHGKHTPHS